MKKRSIAYIASGTVLGCLALAGIYRLVQDNSKAPVQMYYHSTTRPASVRLRWAYDDPSVAKHGVVLTRVDVGRDGARRRLAELNFSPEAYKGGVLDLAMRPLSSNSPKERTLRGTASEFGAIRQAVQATLLAKGGNPERRIAEAIEKSPTLRSFRSGLKPPPGNSDPRIMRSTGVGTVQPRLKPSATPEGRPAGPGAPPASPAGGAARLGGTAGSPVGPGGPQAPAPPDARPAAQILGNVTDEDILQARAQIAMSVLMSSDEDSQKIFAQGYVDNEVSPSGEYIYELSDRAGKVLASQQVKVGSSMPLPVVKIETPIQLGQRRVGLNFSLPAGDSEGKYGKLLFQVTRSDSRGDKIVADRLSLTYSEQKNGDLVASILTAQDDEAPIAGPTRYIVRSIGLFGQLGEAASTEIIMKDLATPESIPGISVLRRDTASPKAYSAIVYWLVPRADSEDRPLTASSCGFTLTRNDIEANAKQAVGTPIMPGSAWTPELETVTTIATLAELMPSIVQRLDGVVTNVVRQEMAPDPITREAVLSKLTSWLQMTVQQFRSGPQTGPTWGEITSLLNLQDIRIFEDVTVPKDTFVSYTVAATLRDTMMDGDPSSTKQLGIPALVLPTSPQSVNLAEAAVPAAGQMIAGGLSRSNNMRMQSEAGLVVGETRTPKYQGDSPEEAGQKMFAEMKSRLPKASADVLPSRRGRTSAARIGARPPAATAIPAGPTAGARLSAPPVGVPTNFGRTVTLKWSPPAYRTKLTYRIYRAIATGYRSASGGHTMPTISRFLRASEPIAAGPRLGGAPGAIPSGVAGPGAAARLGAGLRPQRLAPSTSRIRPAGTLPNNRVYQFDASIPEQEFVLLGETKQGETTFVDPIPRSQSLMLHYYVLPVNRWGEAGARSATAKVKTQPSMPPSPPKFLAASMSTDGTKVTIRLERNLEEEMVAAYEVYRCEIAVPSPMSPSPSSGGTSVSSLPSGLPAQTYGFGRRPSNTLMSDVRRMQAPRRTPTGAILRPGSPGTVGSPVVPQLPPSAQAAIAPRSTSFTLVATRAATAGDPTVMEIFDPSAQQGSAYAYRVVAKNIVALSSQPSSILDVVMLRVIAAPPSISSSTYDEATNEIRVTIQRPEATTRAYIVERAVGTGALTPLGTIPATAGPSTSFVDGAVIPGRSYRYQFKAVDVAGNVSTPAVYARNAANP